MSIPWGYFGASPTYAIPFDQQSSIVRIPIAGPGRFNTLAVLWHRWGVVDRLRPADGKLVRWTGRFPTPLSIPAFDPLSPVSEQCVQSTSANLIVYQAGAEVGAGDAGVEFSWAVDRVHPDPIIDEETGRVALSIDLACAADQSLSNAFIEARTWAMYNDPDQKPVTGLDAFVIRHLDISIEEKPVVEEEVKKRIPILFGREKLSRRNLPHPLR